MPRRSSTRRLIDDVHDITLGEEVVRPTWSAIGRAHPQCAQSAAVNEHNRISLCDALWPQHFDIHLSRHHFLAWRAGVFAANVKKLERSKSALPEYGGNKCKECQAANSGLPPAHVHLPSRTAATVKPFENWAGL